MSDGPAGGLEPRTARTLPSPFRMNDGGAPVCRNTPFQPRRLLPRSQGLRAVGPPRKMQSRVQERYACGVIEPTLYQRFQKPDRVSALFGCDLPFAHSIHQDQQGPSGSRSYLVHISPGFPPDAGIVVPFTDIVRELSFPVTPIPPSGSTSALSRPRHLNW